jgi:hypothetical protein
MPTTPSSPSDFHRTLELNWWRNAPPGMSPEMAEECMARLRAGSTVRKLTTGLRQFGPGLVTCERFKKHCELHPEWAAEAWRISKANTKAARSARFRALTHCKYGHPLSGDNLYSYVSHGRHERKCLTCNKRLAEFGRRMSEEQARRVVEALNGGKTIAESRRPAIPTSSMPQHSFYSERSIRSLIGSSSGYRRRTRRSTSPKRAHVGPKSIERRQSPITGSTSSC